MQVVWLVLFEVDLNVSQTAKQMFEEKTHTHTNTQHKLVARARRHIVCIRFRHILHGRGLRALFLVSH